MNRFVFAALLATAAAATGAAQETGQLDASRTLFTVMAAINAVGYSADLASPNNHPLRDAVRAEIAKRNPPSLPALKAFFEEHRKRSDSAELAQYISFALTCNGPPNFAIANMRDVDIPPDVTPMMGLSPLLAAFYKEAGIEDLWKRSQPAIDQYVERYHAPVAEAVLQVNAYLRQQTSGFRGRHFQIYIELLGGPNEVQTRSYGNEFTIVITPSPEPRIFDVRHAYLQYLLDPLATRNEEILNRKKVARRPRRAGPRAGRFFQGRFSAAGHRIAGQSRRSASGPQARWTRASTSGRLHPGALFRRETAGLREAGRVHAHSTTPRWCGPSICRRKMHGSARWSSTATPPPAPPCRWPRRLLLRR